MNKVILLGRLTRDPEIRYSAGDNSTCVARYTLAVDRRFSKGNDCVAFGKSGEFAEKYLKKGTKMAITGRIQTGSYVNKEGTKVYTTEVVVEDQEFAESKNAQGGGNGQAGGYGGNGYSQNGGYGQGNTAMARTAVGRAARSRTGTAVLPHRARIRETGDTREAAGSSTEMLPRMDIGMAADSNMAVRSRGRTRTAASMVGHLRASIAVRKCSPEWIPEWRWTAIRRSAAGIVSERRPVWRTPSGPVPAGNDEQRP